MKRLARDVLPAPAFDALRRGFNGRQLSRVPAMTVDAAALPCASEVSFRELLRNYDDGPDDGWERAQAAIGAVLGDAPPEHAIAGESRRTLYNLIRRWQPAAVLEIGTNRGISTLHAALAMQAYRNGSGNGARPPRLVTLDLFDVNNPPPAVAKRYHIATPPREWLARLDCADLVEFAVARSTGYLHGRQAQFDFILMDHAPPADVAYQDIVLAIRALRPGGQLLLNNYFPNGKPLRPGQRVIPGPYLAIRRLQREGAGITALPSPAADGSRLTRLALLARE